MCNLHLLSTFILTKMFTKKAYVTYFFTTLCHFTRQFSFKRNGFVVMSTSGIILKTDTVLKKLSTF